MNDDIKSKRIRRCGTCGEIHGFGDISLRCRICGGPIVSLGPIEWTEEDEAKANINLLSDYKNGNGLDLYEDEEGIDLDIDLAKAFELDEDEFQDIVCYLWDMIEEGEDQLIEQVDEIGDLKEKIEVFNAVLDEKNAAIEELKKPKKGLFSKKDKEEESVE